MLWMDKIRYARQHLGIAIFCYPSIHRVSPFPRTGAEVLFFSFLFRWLFRETKQNTKPPRGIGPDGDLARCREGGSCTHLLPGLANRYTAANWPSELIFERLPQKKRKTTSPQMDVPKTAPAFPSRFFLKHQAQNKGYQLEKTRRRPFLHQTSGPPAGRGRLIRCLGLRLGRLKEPTRKYRSSTASERSRRSLSNEQKKAHQTKRKPEIITRAPDLRG